MDFKLVNKKNMGGVSLLLLIIILSQSRFFNFLIDTPLGRAFLIAFIIFISCCNKIMGVVGVLLIIVMFNNSGIGILEGMEAPNLDLLKENIKDKYQATMDASGSATPATTPAATTPAAPTPAPTPATTPAATTTTPATTTPATATATATTPDTVAPPPNLAAKQSSMKSAFGTMKDQAREGFDLIGTENNIKRGKQSNSISVNHNSRNSENVSPYESNVFSTSSYSQF